MNVNLYPEYKDSGLPWVVMLPSHWGTMRAKRLFRRMERAVRPSDEVVTCFRDGTVTLRKNRRTTGFTESLKEIGYQGIRKGDLVIHAMDAFAGAIGVSDSDGKSTPVYAVCQPIGKADSHYFAYIVREMSRTKFIQALATGIRERSTEFRFQTFADQVLPLPPLDEQSKMVIFIKSVEQKINLFIRAKRKIIELLKEQKQAIITKAVTRGIDPNVKLKPSGIDWLGDIPEHWEIRRLKFLAHIKTGGRDTVDRHDDGEYPFFVRSQTIEQIDSFSFDGEAVLTAGDGAGVGKVFHYINGKFDYHQRVYKFSNFKRVKGRFFFYFFGNTLKFEAFRETAKSTVDSLRLPMLQNFPVLLPPQDEQYKILEYMDAATNQIVSAIARVEREIDLIREYRTRLISDVVTGKVCVIEQTQKQAISQRKANPYFKRTVLAAEIISKMHADATFGRTKFQKCLFLAEHYLKLPEIRTKYKRAAAGPLDNRLIHSIEKQLANLKWYQAIEKKDRIFYAPLYKSDDYKKYFGRYWSDAKPALDGLLNLLKPMTTEQAEIVATLFAVWNDFLIRDVSVNDDTIINEVMTNWNESKRRIEKERWQSALSWMKEKELIPSGFGAATFKNLEFEEQLEEAELEEATRGEGEGLEENEKSEEAVDADN